MLSVLRSLTIPGIKVNVKHKWFRFSLRALLVGLTAGAVVVGVLLRRGVEQRIVVACIHEDGGKVQYAHEIDHFGRRPEERSLARASALKKKRTKRTELIPVWLKKFIGEHHFVHVVRVELNDTRLSDSVLAQLKKLPRLRELDLTDTELTDAESRHLPGMHRLEWLQLFGTEIGDECLGHLNELPKLEWLGIGDTRISDAGLQQLSRYPRLSHLNLWGTGVTDAGLLRLA